MLRLLIKTKFLKSLKYIITFITFFGGISIAHAQLDSNKENKKKGKSKAIIAVPAKELKKPKSLDLKNKNGFKGAYTKEQKELAKKQKEKDLENKGILSQKQLTEERFAYSWKKLNLPSPFEDQDLGNFRTNSGKIRILCRDFGYPDDDRVTIYIDDIPIIRNLTLKNGYQEFDIPLIKGPNLITFLALDQGTKGLNTASFKILDEKGNTIMSSQWYLATDSKASVIITKEK